MRTPTTTDAREGFAALAELIVSRNTAEGFATSTGATRRDVEPSEFMLMACNDTEQQYKHRQTRNYVYLRRSIPGDAWRLHVAATRHAFNQGEFDAPPTLAELEALLSIKE
jgi:hypothetical protein